MVLLVEGVLMVWEFIGWVIGSSGAESNSPTLILFDDDGI